MGCEAENDVCLTKICGALLRGGDARCTNEAMANGRCYLHGGLTPAGAASPHYKHGRRCRDRQKVQTQFASVKYPAALAAIDDLMMALEGNFKQVDAIRALCKIRQVVEEAGSRCADRHIEGPSRSALAAVNKRKSSVYKAVTNQFI